MANNSFKVNHSINLTPQASTQSNPDSGDIVFESSRGFTFNRNGFWSDLESVSSITATLSMTSSDFVTTVVQNSIINITGTGIASTIHGLSSSFNGKRVYLYNSTDQTIVIANNSITEPTAANRITAPNNADLNVPPMTSVQLYYDSASTHWILISQPSSGTGGLKNYLPKGNAESGLFGQNYNDGAVTQPVDGISGVFNGTFTISSATPLADENSFVYGPGTTLGQGHSFDFTIDREDLGQVLMIRTSYEITGTYNTGDLAWFVYDITNGNIIQPYNNQIVSASGPQRTISVFKTRTNSTSYRLCLHQVTANNAYTFKFEAAINPQDLAYVPNIQSPQQAGFMQEYGGTTDPKGYFICDGRTVSRAQYPDLFTAIGTSFGAGDGSTTFNIPDMRGRFARGVDGTAGRDPDTTSRTAMNTGGNTGNNVGSVQSDAFRSHTHNLTLDQANGSDNAGFTKWASDSSSFGSSTATTSNTGGNETRPINAYVNYIIKLYNDQYIPVSTASIPYQQEIGFIQASGSNFVGQDFLYCDGSSFAATTYPELFGKIGYNFGGSAGFFNVPDLRGRFLRGLDDIASMTGDGAVVSSNTLVFTANHKLTTGRRIKFNTPGGLSGVNNTTVYYAIVISATSIKVASARSNAFGNLPLTVTGTNTSSVVTYEDPEAASRLIGAVGGTTGQNIGSFEDDTFKAHTHSISVYNTGGGAVVSQGAGGLVASSQQTGSTGDNETRPINVAVKYYIRATPAPLPAAELSASQGVDLVMPANDVDWNVADTFFKDANADFTLTFSNVFNGKTLIVTVRNSGASNITITLPLGIVVPSGMSLVVRPGLYNVYTFFRSNSKTFGTVIQDMA